MQAIPGLILISLVAWAASENRAARGSLGRIIAASILTYAMCGFANIGSVVPERRAEIARLSIEALGSGLLATLRTARR